VETVRRQAEQAGIGMPEVAVYHAPEPNAFATGASRNNALVAVSTGLLEEMDRDEVEAVLGHEVSPIANGDMVTLSLIQSEPSHLPAEMAAFGIRGGGGLTRLFMTDPPLEGRIAALRSQA
jgi:Zn-dependent protease with chaperone function